jgi:DNA polymerase bacteriophage-type
MTTMMTLPKHLSVDIETYSSADITKSGVYRYAEAPDFQILLIGYRFEDMDKTEVVDLSSYSGANAKEDAVDCIRREHTRLFYALLSDDVTKHAFNANFERTCLAQYFGYMPPEQWECTMIRAAALGLPMSLAGVGDALGLSEDEAKLKTGKALITYFCKPCKPTKSNGGRTRNFPEHAPDKWELFKEYNARDVDAELTIYRRLEEYGHANPNEQRLWEWDQRTNDNGVRLDVPYIEGIIEYDAKRTAELTDEAARLTGLANPNSVAQLKAWLKGEGVEMEGVTKETMKEALKRDDLPIKVRRVLEIRQALGKTSVKKYQAMLAAVCKDDRLRGILQFYGANRTGRWAGRIVQTHNLPQNHLDDLDYCRELVAAKDFEAVEMIWGETAFVFSELVRTAFVPSEGCRFVVCDFSAVEARILGWLAHEKWREEVFENGGGIYCASASKMYGVEVVKHGVNGHLRQRGKVAELALGYQGGVGAMKRMDTTGSIPEEEMQGIVDDWRAASPHIVKLWSKMEAAAKAAILQMTPEDKAFTTGRSHRVKFYYKNGCLFMVLPSGRKLCYWNARVVRMTDGREHITYSGMNQETKQWTTAETYGGKLVENCVQAIGRDCLAEAMQRVAAMGYQIVMHVHDEMIVDVPKEDTEAYDRISEAMGQSPSWAPELILRGDGYETSYYKKD